ncbi:MAG: cytochrome C oxidase subunit IV family protein [Bacteroidetes bacterium]|nr:cytochrome C oxidase subunit IV family protein [Bacteroidota bacterium]MCL5737382.1 cytochrome C oxidase subunit IV family protein [Bacteroidota bacterium]
MEAQEAKSHSEQISHGTYVLVWLALIVLTCITVAASGINLAAFTIVVTLLIALTKASLVVNIFMHIKFEDKIFKVFLGIAGFTLFVIFSLTFADVFFRR